tara:strand:+ start:633 stop:1025 length:393 start_codon:yes stop_codon:yes gene_type:complete
MSKYAYLDWLDFDLAISRLYDRYKGMEFSGIYGVKRGGLILAVALSHQLKLKFLQKPEKNCLWVDDIIDSERTFNKYKGKCKEYCCWVSKKDNSKYFSLLLSKKWVVFPWESAKYTDIKEDYRKYVERIT